MVHTYVATMRPDGGSDGCAQHNNRATAAAVAKCARKLMHGGHGVRMIGGMEAIADGAEDALFRELVRRVREE